MADIIYAIGIQHAAIHNTGIKLVDFIVRKDRTMPGVKQRALFK
ncbi:MAG: hypothetical protein ACSLEL_00570 [Candidatus Malihini olakiniferum]